MGTPSPLSLINRKTTNTTKKPNQQEFDHSSKYSCWLGKPVDNLSLSQPETGFFYRLLDITIS